MSHKIFAERLNSELDQIDFPSKLDERVEAFAKLLDIPRFKAESILSGAILPEEELLMRIAEELEVDPGWLLGN